MNIVYLKIPPDHKYAYARAVAKNNGATWNTVLKLWEHDEDAKTLRRSLKKYVVFDEKDAKTYKNKFTVHRKDIKAVLSVRDINFLDALMKHNGNVSKAADEVGYNPKHGDVLAKRVFANPEAQVYITAQHEKTAAEFRWTYEEKMQTLKRITELAVPATAESIKDTLPGAAIQAIAESNKMQGDYSAEKRVNVNVNVDPDLQAVLDIVGKFENEY